MQSPRRRSSSGCNQREGFVDHVPEYPYGFLSSPGIAGERGLVPRYVVGRDELPDAGDVTSIDVGGYGPFVVRGLERRWGPGNAYRLARIVESPSLEPS